MSPLPMTVTVAEAKHEQQTHVGAFRAAKPEENYVHRREIKRWEGMMATDGHR